MNRTIQKSEEEYSSKKKYTDDRPYNQDRVFFYIYSTLLTTVPYTVAVRNYTEWEKTLLILTRNSSPSPDTFCRFPLGIWEGRKFKRSIAVPILCCSS